VLDAAALDTTEPTTLERVHLLRAQCYAARQEFTRTEEAFALALDANPDTTLDPAKVDPTLVKMLDSVRARLTGTVVVGSSPAGATVSMDGRPQGVTPLTLQVPIGKHHLEARWGDGTATSTDVQLRPRREVRVEWVQGAPQLVAVKDTPDPRKLSPYGDFRFLPEVSAIPNADVLYALEVGGGIELSYFRIGLGVRLWQYFGLVPRFAFALPVLDKLTITLEVNVPFTFFPGSVGIGGSGYAGAEYYPVRWLGVFAMVGARYYFAGRGNDKTAFVPVAGVRLRLP